jgi:indole-3-glycerol phosphate synthase
MSAPARAALLAAVARRAAERRRAQPLERLEELVAPDSWRRERFLQALHGSAPALIAVCQRRTPSAGALLEEEPRAGTRPARLPLPGPRWFAFVDACRTGGAAALAVVTELDHYGGALEDLQTVAHARLSRLRLDFPLDRGMVLESCLAGADALRIVAADLPGNELRALRECCREFGLAVVLEVQDADELARALPLEPEAVCVPAREPQLLQSIPKGPLRLAAGGIRTAADARRLCEAGAQALLVGEALARAEDPAALLAGMRAALSGLG